MTKMDKIIESLREDGVPVNGSIIWVSIWTCSCDMCWREIYHEDCLYVSNPFSKTLHLCLDREACRKRVESKSRMTTEDIEKVERLVVLPSEGEE